MRIPIVAPMCRLYQASVVFSDLIGCLNALSSLQTRLAGVSDEPDQIQYFIIKKEDKDKEEEDEHEEGKRVQLPILTRTIHPIDNQTYWGLHPCNTQTILKEILDEEHRNHPQKLPPQLVIESFFALVSSKIRPPQHYLL
ncbi:hypothetical protein PGTUg99_035112 [Puccinia graminis f. sp. tritici]|uniref:Uncharacterized protein n=1 Tax=Puccinia graminis f. sp. tritici TaxID=56615 RepID=A0A5B0PNS5_PUCGR|nr:hypothetical protein PGTUg99_035112 [Puccinia graminis f. sp. tritici]